MRGIRKSLLQFIFSGASMRRWNDKLRPAELFELDKQAHKMIAAFLLWQKNCAGHDRGENIRTGIEIVEGGIFDYFYRLIITDIKPPVFYRIKSNPEHAEKLTEWVLGQLEPLIRPLDERFWQRLEHYHRRREGECGGTADKILRAAHMYASRWEFKIIRPLNWFDEEMEEIENSFNRQLLGLQDVPGVSDLLAGSGSAFARLANFCGQLRFQIRWANTPRVPATSVLGHMFVVAVFSYLFSLFMEACPQRRLNDFYCGLFHDLAELLTRDIITPVKRSVDELPSLIHEYEEEELRRKILLPLEEDGCSAIRERLEYYLGLSVGSEFYDSCVKDGAVTRVKDFNELQKNFNEDRFDPKDDDLIKACDNLAAFLEAYTSIHNGVASPHLYEAVVRMRHNNTARFNGFNMATLLADFE